MHSSGKGFQNVDGYLDDYEYELDDDLVIRKVGSGRESNISNIVIARVSSDMELASLVKIQEALWSEEYWDDEMRMIDYNLSPSYIISSESGNTVFGYLVSRLVPIEVEGDSERVCEEIYIQSKHELNKYMKSDCEIGIAFDDLFIVNNIRVLKSCKYISDSILKFIKEFNIKYSTANTNSHSRKIVRKFLINNTKYIEDMYTGSYYVESFSETNGKSPKLPKGLLSDNLKINFI